MYLYEFDEAHFKKVLWQVMVLEDKVVELTDLVARTQNNLEKLKWVNEKVVKKLKHLLVRDELIEEIEEIENKIDYNEYCTRLEDSYKIFDIEHWDDYSEYNLGEKK